MINLNAPTVVALWPNISTVNTMVESLLLERFKLIRTPEILNSGSMVDINNRLSGRGLLPNDLSAMVWSDPLDEQDLILLVDSSTVQPRTPTEFLRHCPHQTHNVITFAVIQSETCGSEYQVSVATARNQDRMALDRQIHHCQHDRLSGPGTTAKQLLDEAARSDIAAYCIVIEIPFGRNQIPQAAAEDALHVFSRLTLIETLPEHRESQPQWMHECLQQLSAKL